MATKLGDHCARCGAKSLRRISEVGGVRKMIYECPNNHGIQRIEPVPEDETEEQVLQQDQAEETKDTNENGLLNVPADRVPADHVDDVAAAVDHGTGNHN